MGNSVEQAISEVLMVGSGLSAYNYGKEESAEALMKHGWEPVIVPELAYELAKKIMANFTRVQVFFNSDTIAKYAFLGYHECSGKQVLWLRVIGDNELLYS